MQYGPHTAIITSSCLTAVSPPPQSPHPTENPHLNPNTDIIHPSDLFLSNSFVSCPDHRPPRAFLKTHLPPPDHPQYRTAISNQRPTTTDQGTTTIDGCRPRRSRSDTRPANINGISPNVTLLPGVRQDEDKATEPCQLCLRPPLRLRLRPRPPNTTTRTRTASAIAKSTL